jgi:hypothetical protein
VNIHEWEKKVNEHFTQLTPISRQLNNAKDDHCQGLIDLLIKHLDFATTQLRTVRTWTQQARHVMDGSSDFSVDEVRELVTKGNGERIFMKISHRQVYFYVKTADGCPFVCRNVGLSSISVIAERINPDHRRVGGGNSQCR